MRKHNDRLADPSEVLEDTPSNCPGTKSSEMTPISPFTDRLRIKSPCVPRTPTSKTCSRADVAWPPFPLPRSPRRIPLTAHKSWIPRQGIQVAKCSLNKCFTSMYSVTPYTMAFNCPFCSLSVSSLSSNSTSSMTLFVPSKRSPVHARSTTTTSATSSSLVLRLRILLTGLDDGDAVPDAVPVSRRAGYRRSWRWVRQ